MYICNHTLIYLCIHIFLNEFTCQKVHAILAQNILKLQLPIFEDTEQPIFI